MCCKYFELSYDTNYDGIFCAANIFTVNLLYLGKQVASSIYISLTISGFKTGKSALCKFAASAKRARCLPNSPNAEKNQQFLRNRISRPCTMFAEQYPHPKKATAPLRRCVSRLFTMFTEQFLTKATRKFLA